MGLTRVLVLFFRVLFLDRTELAAENLALRQQVAALHHNMSPRPCRGASRQRPLKEIQSLTVAVELGTSRAARLPRLTMTPRKGE